MAQALINYNQLNQTISFTTGTTSSSAIDIKAAVSSTGLSRLIADSDSTSSIMVIANNSGSINNGIATGTVGIASVSPGSGGAIATFGGITAGTGYVNGSYTNVPLTGGTGTGATANITVAGGGVTVVVLAVPGTGYVSADVLSASNTNLGGTGSGFSINVSTVRFGTDITMGVNGTERIRLTDDTGSNTTLQIINKTPFVVTNFGFAELAVQVSGGSTTMTSRNGLGAQALVSIASAHRLQTTGTLTGVSVYNNITGPFNGAVQFHQYGAGVLVTDSSGNITASGSAGTVTSVNITPSNGITSSGGPITSSGAITLGLGDITPNSVTITTNLIVSSLTTPGVVVTNNGFGTFTTQTTVPPQFTNNQDVGFATLSSGSVTVMSANITSNSYVFLTYVDPPVGAGPFVLYYNFASTIDNTSFVVNSTDPTDGSTFSWFIVNPS